MKALVKLVCFLSILSLNCTRVEENTTPKGVVMPEGIFPTSYFNDFFQYCRPAWVNQNNPYEAWPFGGLFYDRNTNMFCLAYSSRESHANVSKSCGQALFRRRSSNGNWSEPVLIETFEKVDSTVYSSVRCQAAGIAANGDYIALVLYELKNSNLGHVYKYRSKDCGMSWKCEGALLINGKIPVCSEITSVFLSHSGRLFSFASTGVNGSVVSSPGQVFISDNNGYTWNGIIMPDNMGFMEGSFIELEEGEIWCIARKDESFLIDSFPRIAKSTDNGITWGDIRILEIKAINTPVSQLTVGKQIVLLYGNRWYDENDLMSLYINSLSREKYRNGSFSEGEVRVASFSKPDITYPFADFSYAAISSSSDSLIGLFYYSRPPYKTGIYEIVGSLDSINCD